MSAAASIGVHLVRAGLSLRYVTDAGETLPAASADGGFEGLLLDRLAITRRSKDPSLTAGVAALRGRTGSAHDADGLVIAVFGVLTAEEARSVAAARRGAGTCVAVLVEGTRGRRPPGDAAANGRANGRADAAADARVPAETAAGLLRAAGWRVVTIRSAADLPGAGRGPPGPARTSSGTAHENPHTVMAGLATVAGSVGLYPLFEEHGWFAAGLGAVIAVACGGLLARRLRLPAPFNALFGLLALLVYLTVTYAADEAWLGFVPSPGSIAHLGALNEAGWAAANRYAAPVPLLPGISLMAAAGIGLVAVLVDLLAVRLRRTAPAGLPLLAMYSVPAAVRDDGVSWVAFGIGALGFLGLLMADAREQVAGWGRAVTTQRRQREVPLAGSRPRPEESAARLDATALAASGRRIGAVAVAVAVLAPAAVPGLTPRGFLDLGGGTGDGTQTVTTPDPLVSLKRELTRLDDSVVLTYRTDDRRGPDYLRLYALDRFDGEDLQPAAEQLPGPAQDGDALPRRPA